MNESMVHIAYGGPTYDSNSRALQENHSLTAINEGGGLS